MGPGSNSKQLQFEQACARKPNSTGVGGKLITSSIAVPQRGQDKDFSPLGTSGANSMSHLFQGRV